MNSFKIQIPEGVRDFTGREEYGKRELEKKFRDTMLMAGYGEIETPAFEFSSVFEGSIGEFRQAKMIRFTNTDGRMLVLRPDLTMPAGRAVAVRKNELTLPAKIFYIGDAFGREYDGGMQRRQFTQAGAEIMGEGCPLADVEIIAMAAAALKAIGMDDFLLDIGHVGVFLGLLENTGLDHEEAEALRGIIDEKNEPEAELFLEQHDIKGEKAESFLKLIDYFGSPDILNIAQRELKREKCAAAIGDLKQICAMLEEAGLGERLSVDLGLLPNLDYYSGPVFRGIAEGIGYQLVSGGRYDGALKRFGLDIPATGFAIGMERALSAVEKRGRVPEQERLYAVTGAEEGCMSQALLYAREKRCEGRPVLTGFAKDKSALIEQAKRENALRAVFFKKGGCEEFELEEGGV